MERRVSFMLPVYAEHVACQRSLADSDVMETAAWLNTGYHRARHLRLTGLQCEICIGVPARLAVPATVLCHVLSNRLNASLPVFTDWMMTPSLAILRSVFQVRKSQEARLLC